MQYNSHLHLIQRRSLFILICDHSIGKKVPTFISIKDLTFLYQGFGREKDGNRGKFIGSNLVIFCYKEFEKFTPCKSLNHVYCLL